MSKIDKLQNVLYQRQKTWSCFLSKEQNLVISFVKNTNIVVLYELSYTWSSTPYFLRPNIKSYTRMQAILLNLLAMSLQF